MRTKTRLFILALLFYSCALNPVIQATLPESPELPMEISTTLMALEETQGKPGSHFEYNVSVTAPFGLDEVELYFTHPDEIVFDEQPQLFRGTLKAGETKTWKIKGTMTKLISFEDGNVLHPPIRLEGTYLYPYDAVRRDVLRIFEEGRGIRGAMDVDDALQEMERRELKGKKMKVLEIWMP
ncbi:MAG: hypothetical protein PHN49_11660 [Candidatus Omnitrophica bacterium]|nr:hypothetical protein [Candidatus Omnitrophota bacterium]